MKPFNTTGIARSITREVLLGAMGLEAALTLPRSEVQLFDGETFDAARDGARLTSQLDRVREFMRDGRWHTLQDIVCKCGGTEASASARLRDLRKPRFGGHTVDRRHESAGLWSYRLTMKLI